MPGKSRLRKTMRGKARPGRARGRAEASPPPASLRQRRARRRMTGPVVAYVGLGGNLGDVAATLRAATDALAHLPETCLLRASRLYRTPAWGLERQPDFVNGVVALETSLGRRELLDALLGIERGFGRERDGGPRWGPRTLDLDLLLHGDAVVDQAGLRVPHPHLHERAFALVPLLEIAPDILIPGQGSARDALSRLERRPSMHWSDNRAMSTHAEISKWTLPHWPSAKRGGRKLVMLTAYDASFARVVDANGVDLVLVGDSLGMVVQGRDSTLPVTVDDIAYHTAAVARGLSRAHAGRRPAVPVRRHPGARLAGVDRAAPGRRGNGQAGRRGPQAGSDPLPGRARDPGLRASGADPAVGAAPRRLQGAGARRSRRRAAARRRAGGRRCRRLDAGAGMRAVVAGRRDHRGQRRSPPSASAPGRTAMARCWCCTTCWASTPATAGRSSSRISSPTAVRSPGAIARLCGRGARRLASPMQNTPTDATAPPREAQ